MSKGFIALTTGLFLLISCAPKQNDQVLSVGDYSGIIQGDIVADGNPIARSTVQLIRFKDPQTLTHPKPAGSATIISESIVLTAAHCMTKTTKVDVADLWIYFSAKVPSSKGPLPKSLLRKVVNGALSPGWEDSDSRIFHGQNNADDIGILSFSGGLPKNFNAVRLVEPTTVLKAHQQVVAAGFGENEIESSDNALAPQLLTANFEITDPNFAEREFSAHDPNKKQFMCFGDSGGSMYIHDSNGNLLLAGIIARGRAIVADWSLPTCGENVIQIFTKVSSYLDWISSESEKLNNDRLELEGKAKL